MIFEKRKQKESKSKGIPVSDTAEGKLYIQIAKGKCPSCGSKGFYEGPHGGLCINIFCMNPACRQGYNVTPAVGVAELIHKADPSRYPRSN